MSPSQYALPSLVFVRNWPKMESDSKELCDALNAVPTPSLPVARKQYDRLLQTLMPATPHLLADTDTYDIPSRETSFPMVRLIQSKKNGRNTGVVLYVHGGGWVQGSLDGYDAILRRLSLLGGFCVVAIEYSLAPEAKAPTAFEECMRVLEAVVCHSSFGCHFLDKRKWEYAANSLHFITCRPMAD